MAQAFWNAIGLLVTIILAIILVVLVVGLWPYLPEMKPLLLVKTEYRDRIVKVPVIREIVIPQQTVVIHNHVEALPPEVIYRDPPVIVYRGMPESGLACKYDCDCDDYCD